MSLKKAQIILTLVFLRNHARSFIQQTLLCSLKDNDIPRGLVLDSTAVFSPHCYGAQSTGSPHYLHWTIYMGLPQKSKNINYFLSHLNGKANVTYMSILKTKPNHTLVVDRLVLGEGREQPGQVQPESHQLHHFAALPHTPSLAIPS